MNLREFMEVCVTLRGYPPGLFAFYDGRNKTPQQILDRQAVTGAVRYWTNATLPELAVTIGKRNHSTLLKQQTKFEAWPKQERQQWLDAVKGAMSKRGLQPVKRSVIKYNVETVGAFSEQIRRRRY